MKCEANKIKITTIKTENKYENDIIEQSRLFK